MRYAGWWVGWGKVSCCKLVLVEAAVCQSQSLLVRPSPCLLPLAPTFLQLYLLVLIASAKFSSLIEGNLNPVGGNRVGLLIWQSDTQCTVYSDTQCTQWTAILLYTVSIAPSAQWHPVHPVNCNTFVHSVSVTPSAQCTVHSEQWTVTPSAPNGRQYFCTLYQWHPVHSDTQCTETNFLVIDTALPALPVDHSY